MMTTVEAVVKNGQIVPLENIELPEGTRALITILPEEEREFWMGASEESANKIWGNEEDDVYGELLAK